MLLAKDQGGCTITHEGAVYAWPEDGSSCEVPENLGLELLALGGFSVSEPPDPAAPEDGEDAADSGAAKPAPRRSSRKPA